MTQLAAIVLAFIVGCSFTPPAELPPDAAPDATATLGLVGAQIPLRIATSDSVTLSFTVTGPPAASIAWRVTSGAGTFTPDHDSAATTATGVATFHTQYTAPATGDDYANLLELSSGDEQATPSFTTPVRALFSAGESTAFAGPDGHALTANYLYMQSLHLDAPAVLMALCLIQDTAPGPNGRMALYADASGVPGALLASSSTLPLAPFAELHVAPTQLSAGDYWIAANMGNSAAVRVDPTRTVNHAYLVVPVANALPDPAGDVMTVDQVVLNYYVRLAD